MPKYFHSIAHQLLIEAQASYLIIQNLAARSVQHGSITEKMLKVYQNAGARVYRRQLNVNSNCICGR